MIKLLNRLDLYTLTNEESLASLIKYMNALKEFDCVEEYAPVDDGFFYLLMQLVTGLTTKEYKDAIITLSALQHRYPLHDKHRAEMLYYTLNRYIGDNHV